MRHEQAVQHKVPSGQVGKGKARPKPGFDLESASLYLAMRSFERLVPIWLKIVPMPDELVTRKNLSDVLAQFCNKVEVGSPPVSTWTV
jgi:hypothetical protein